MSHPRAETSGGTSKVNPIALAKPVDAYPSVAEFLQSCKSKYTAKGYKTGLSKCFNFLAVENAELDPDVAITMKPDQLNPIILKYAMHLKKVAKTTTDFKHGEISVNSVSFYLSPVKKFFDYHDIILNWKKIRRFVPEETLRHYHVYDRAELAKLLAVANHRERVIILILLSSGMRAQALVQLQIRDLQVLPDGIGHLIAYARTRDFYHTFCTPECVAAINFYLKWREEMGEEIKPDSPLIRDSIKDGFAKATKKPHAISYMRLWEIMQKLIKKAGLKDRTNIQPNHSFRKFMNTVVANAKANPLFKEIMLGHSLKLDNMYYDREDPNSQEALHQEYLKAVDYLTINDEYKLRQENVQLKEELSQTAPKNMVADLLVKQQALIDDNAAMKERLKKLELKEGIMGDPPSP